MYPRMTRQLSWLCAAALIVSMAGCPPGGLGPGASFPIRDPAVLEDIGRHALALHGFEGIMSRAIDAGLVVKTSPDYAQSTIPASDHGPTAPAVTRFSLTAAAIWRGVATTVEIVTAESLVILGGLALVLTMEGDGPLANERCPPCRTVSGKVVPVGTIAHRPLDTPPTGKPEHGIIGPHYNIYRANQSPKNSPQPCRCFWQPVGAVPPSGLPPGAIPIEPFAY